jgi:prepilin-type N-terminal cleavage/methylation domain-containing protein
VKRSSGFTLIEILVAIAILATVLTSVYAAYTGTLKIVKDMEYTDTIYRMARSTMKRITEDVASLYKYKNGFVFNSRSSEQAGPGFTDLSFLSSSHLPFRDNDGATLGTIRYYVKETEDKNVVLFRQDTPFRGEDETEEEEALEPAFIMCDRLKSLSFTFYSIKGDELESWDSSEDGKESKQAPAVVAVRIEFVNPESEDKPYVFTTKIYIPMTGGA